MIRLLLILISLTLACSNVETNNKIANQSLDSVVLQTAKNKVVMDSSMAQFDIDYLMGKFEPSEHPDFSLIATKYADREGLYLRKDTYEAFKKMYNAALKDSVKLIIRSATRNFNAQKGIWEAKWTGARKIENGENLALTTPDSTERALKILRFSSMPGTSRHHWGTDIDLNAFTNAYFDTGKGKKIYDWLTANAADFGFCQPYSPKGVARPNGYNEERWHWSYLPIAQRLTKIAARQMKDEMITGFKGATSAKNIKVVSKYILGINKDCLNNPE